MVKRINQILFIVLFAVLAGLIAWLVSYSGVYTSDSNAMSFLYRAEALCRNIGQGSSYPLYDPMWYNGMEIIRCQPPLPIFFIALCRTVMGGNLLSGYLIFVGAVFFIGACIWLYIGKYHNRMYFGAFLGILWFFMPNNLYILFLEGDLAKTLCVAILPLFIHGIYIYLDENKLSGLLKTIICFFLIVMCQIQFAAMVAISIVIFLVIDGIIKRRWRAGLHIVFCMIIAFLCGGVWLVPYFSADVGSTEVFSRFFQSIFITLNPFYRQTHGINTSYFGLAAMITAVLGLLFGGRKTSSGFLTAILICLCTTLSAMPVVGVMPGHDNLLMLRFISIALCFILYGFVMWNSLKKPIFFVLCALLVLDAAPSLSLVHGNFQGIASDEVLNKLGEETLLGAAKETTHQRIAFLDGDTYGANASYYISGFGEGIASTYGADNESANISRNIMLLNEAMENGSYLYIFDRCLELGNDTVVIRISSLRHGSQDIDVLKQAAAQVGYKEKEYNGEFIVFNVDTGGSFGTINHYRAIGIGSAAAELSIMFPGLEETISSNLNDYTFEELSGYDAVYLADFTYDDRASAEELITRLSREGVRIVIEAGGIPADKHTGIRRFLGAETHAINFSNGYPLLYTIDGTLDCDLFPEGYSDWKTVYVNGLDECMGYIDDMGERLEFFGTVENENIYVVGLGIGYHHCLTGDPSTGKLLSRAMDLRADEVPERTIVPLVVDYQPDKIVIKSSQDNINTTLAWHDTFRSDKNIENRNHLMYVNSGTTEIYVAYPYLWQGLLMSAVGVALAVLFLIFIKRNPLDMTEKKS